MIAVDTSVLVYAVVQTDPRHMDCAAFLRRSVRVGQVVIVWPVLYEFLRIVTHRRVLQRPLSMAQAWEFLEALTGHPSVLLVGEGNRQLHAAKRALSAPGVTGNLVHDAHIAAILAERGVGRLATYDQDFHRFEGLTLVRPGA
jgi:uncharacterized protein